MRDKIKTAIIKKFNNFLDEFQLWLEQDTEAKYEPYDGAWMDEVKYGNH